MVEIKPLIMENKAKMLENISETVQKTKTVLLQSVYMPLIEPDILTTDEQIFVLELMESITENLSKIQKVINKDRDVKT